MNFAFALSLVTFTLNLAVAAGHFAVSRAPGWRVSRAFSVVALTACGYGLGDMVFTQSGLPDAVYIGAVRWAYFVAHLHVIAWYPLAFGGPEAAFSSLSRRMRGFCVASFAIAAFFAVTGANVTVPLYVLRVPWANATYHYVPTTPVGDVYGAFCLLSLGVPFVQFIRRMRRGERELVWTVAGFCVFYASAVLEVLVASRVVRTLSVADLGFLAVVLPTSAHLVRRFNADARRLAALGSDLASQVRVRTEQLEQARSALVESERLAALGRLAAGVGHEINNPLTYVQLSLEEIAEHIGRTDAPAGVRAALGNAMGGTQRIQKVVEGLRTYARRDGEFVTVDPHDVVRAALGAAEPQTRLVGTLESRLEDAPRVAGDPPRLVQAVANLLVNAAQAVAGRPGGGHVVVRTCAGPEGECRIEIEDDGPGIPAEHRARVLEPYYTTRAAQGGLGLGLFVARGIVDAHGGRLAFEDAPGRGVRAVLALPAQAPGGLHHLPLAPAVGTPFPPGPGGPQAAPARRARLLLVDDDPMVLRLLARLLETEWDVTSVPSAAEALALADREPFDAMLCDLMMPDVSGIDLARLLEDRHPALRRRAVFLTGGAVTPEAQRFLARPDVRHVLKPADAAELSRALAEACGFSSGGA